MSTVSTRVKVYVRLTHEYSIFVRSWGDQIWQSNRKFTTKIDWVFVRNFIRNNNQRQRRQKRGSGKIIDFGRDEIGNWKYGIGRLSTSREDVDGEFCHIVCAKYRRIRRRWWSEYENWGFQTTKSTRCRRAQAVYSRGFEWSWEAGARKTRSAGGKLTQRITTKHISDIFMKIDSFFIKLLETFSDSAWNASHYHIFFAVFLHIAEFALIIFSLVIVFFFLFLAMFRWCSHSSSTRRQGNETWMPLWQV